MTAAAGKTDGQSARRRKAAEHGKIERRKLRRRDPDLLLDDERERALQELAAARETDRIAASELDLDERAARIGDPREYLELQRARLIARLERIAQRQELADPALTAQISLQLIRMTSLAPQASNPLVNINAALLRLAPVSPELSSVTDEELERLEHAGTVTVEPTTSSTVAADDEPNDSK